MQKALDLILSTRKIMHIQYLMLMSKEAGKGWRKPKCSLGHQPLIVYPNFKTF
jgi:hypothetical protein